LDGGSTLDGGSRLDGGSTLDGWSHPDGGATDGGSHPDGGAVDGGPVLGDHIETVFVILMENHNWSAIKGCTSAPYMNNTLLPMASRAERYYNPPGIHPSEPNYLWIEAGTNFGILNDYSVATNHQSTTAHLVTQLYNAGITWRTYQEDISGTVCP